MGCGAQNSRFWRAQLKGCGHRARRIFIWSPHVLHPTCTCRHCRTSMRGAAACSGHVDTSSAHPAQLTTRLIPTQSSLRQPQRYGDLCILAHVDHVRLPPHCSAAACAALPGGQGPDAQVADLQLLTKLAGPRPSPVRHLAGRVCRQPHLRHRHERMRSWTYSRRRPVRPVSG